MIGRGILAVLYAAFAMAGVIIAVAFATGSTFGQRCARIHHHGSPAWEHCVEYFATGRSRHQTEPK